MEVQLKYIETAVKQNLVSINKFFINHQLLLNFSKTNFIQFSTYQSRNVISPSIVLESHTNKEVESTKFLGLTIDNHLNWNVHIDLLSKKLTSGIFALYRMAQTCDLEVLKTIYYAYIHSIISLWVHIKKEFK